MCLDPVETGSGRATFRGQAIGMGAGNANGFMHRVGPSPALIIALIALMACLGAPVCRFHASAQQRRRQAAEERRGHRRQGQAPFAHRRADQPLKLGTVPTARNAGRAPRAGTAAPVGKAGGALTGGIRTLHRPGRAGPPGGRPRPAGVRCPVDDVARRRMERPSSPPLLQGSVQNVHLQGDVTRPGDQFDGCGIFRLPLPATARWVESRTSPLMASRAPRPAVAVRSTDCAVVFVSGTTSFIGLGAISFRGG